MAKAAKDAGDNMREAIASLEERIDAVTTALLGTEEFARTANLASNLQLRMQKGVASHMARQLALFNMPSREDITAIGERLMVMDERLIRLEQLMKQMAPASAPAKAPPRTKKAAAKKKTAAKRARKGA